MAQTPPTPPSDTPNRPASYNWLFIPAIVLAVAAFGGGVALAVLASDYTLLAGGSVAIVTALSLLPIAASLRQNVDGCIEQRLKPIEDHLQKIGVSLSLISEQQLISDRAKAVAFRERDRDAFRRAIQEDLSKQDFDAALALVTDMDGQFGYRNEAERLRQEVLARRDEVVRRQLDAAIAQVERQVQAEQWPQALREAERIRSLFPTQTRAQNLANEIEQRRLAVKRNLLLRWQDMVKAMKVDDAIDTLKQLDAYLTPVEAAALEDDARMVFKEKMNRLRSDFTNAVHHGRTAEAIRIGEQIITDFPNTQMAAEIRERMDKLRDRLRQEQEAAAAVTAPVG